MLNLTLVFGNLVVTSFTLNFCQTKIDYCQTGPKIHVGNLKYQTLNQKTTNKKNQNSNQNNFFYKNRKQTKNHENRQILPVAGF